MARLMRCLYCGLLQDEPEGVKACVRCGGELAFDAEPQPNQRGSYVKAEMELDQVKAPAERNVDRHLLVTVRAPAQVPPEEAVSTETGRSPLGFTAVLDVSGSMRGQKLAQAKEAVRQALARLHDGDVFALVAFASEVDCAFEPVALDDQTRRTARSVLEGIGAGGQTALCGGLERGLEKAAALKQETNLVMLLSDGQANVGETDVEAVGRRAHEARQKGITVSTLGVGRNYNEALMAEIATEGGGRFYHVMSADQIGAYMTGELGEVAALAARDTKIKLTLPSGATLVPLSAAYPSQQDGGQAVVSVGDIPCDTELEIPMRLTVPAQRAGSRLSVEGAVTYRSPAGNHLETRLNRVTMRFVEGAAFSLREGVVVPVAERVLGHMKAASVLGVSRARTKSAAEGARRAHAGVDALREYAVLLGEERAVEEALEMETAFARMSAAPGVAKSMVANAYSVHRTTKTFGKKRTK